MHPYLLMTRDLRAVVLICQNNRQPFVSSIRAQVYLWASQVLVHLHRRDADGLPARLVNTLL